MIKDLLNNPSYVLFTPMIHLDNSGVDIFYNDEIDSSIFIDHVPPGNILGLFPYVNATINFHSSLYSLLAQYIEFISLQKPNVDIRFINILIVETRGSDEFLSSLKLEGNEYDLPYTYSYELDNSSISKFYHTNLYVLKIDISDYLHIFNQDFISHLHSKVEDSIERNGDENFYFNIEDVLNKSYIQNEFLIPV